jgi:hypothetical protein
MRVSLHLHLHLLLLLLNQVLRVLVNAGAGNAALVFKELPRPYSHTAAAAAED